MILWVDWTRLDCSYFGLSYNWSHMTSGAWVIWKLYWAEYFIFTLMVMVSSVYPLKAQLGLLPWDTYTWTLLVTWASCGAASRFSESVSQEKAFQLMKEKVPGQKRSCPNCATLLYFIVQGLNIWPKFKRVEKLTPLFLDEGISRSSYRRAYKMFLWSSLENIICYT